MCNLYVNVYRCRYTDTILGFLWKYNGFNKLCQANGRSTIEKWKFMESSGRFSTELTVVLTEKDHH